LTLNASTRHDGIWDLLSGSLHEIREAEATASPLLLIDRHAAGAGA
jgi:hypothetical protein